MRTWTWIPWLPPTIQQWLMQPLRYFGRNAAGKSHGSQKMFSTSVMRGEIFKKKRYEAEGAKEYREANRKIQKAVKKAKEDWIGAQCEEIEACLNNNNNKRAYQMVKDLTSEKQGRSSTIQDKSGKCLTEEKRDSQQMDRILLRTVQLCELWRQHCTGLQPAPKRRSATNPPWGSWDGSSITEKGEVCRSW